MEKSSRLGVVIDKSNVDWSKVEDNIAYLLEKIGWELGPPVFVFMPPHEAKHLMPIKDNE